MTAITITDLNNAKLDVDHIADVATSINLTSTDRLGAVKSTVKGAVLTLSAFNVRGAFVGATAYALKDVYTASGIAYVAVIAHTSASVAADLASGKVTVHQGATKEDLAGFGGAGLVGYMPAGVGSIALTVQNFLRRFVAIEGFGADGTQAGDSAAIKAAINHAELLNLPVLLPARRIYWDGSPILNDKVRLWGNGMPAVNAGKTALLGGTIIEGKLIVTGKTISLKDFGVDLGTGGLGPDADGIKCTCATLNGGIHLHVENLVTLCKSKTSTFHSMLFESYLKVTGGNLHAVNGYFGVVIKCQNVQLSSIHTQTQNETGVYLKSDNVYGTCGNIQIDSIRTESADQFGLRVQSDSAPLNNVQIGKLHGSDHGRTVCVQILSPNGVETTSIDIGSVLSERSITACFSVLSQNASGSAFDVGCNQLISINPTAQILEATPEPGCSINNLRIGRIFASYALGTSQVVMDAAANIADGTNSSDIKSIEIVEGFGIGTKLGTLNYANLSTFGANILGSHRCRITGAGRPQSGSRNQTLSGATATLLIADNTSGADTSLSKVTITADTTINTFASQLAGHVFAPGHILMVLNNSFFTLNVIHNVGGGIINNNSLTVAIGGNQVSMWVNIGGIYWSQLKTT